MPHDRNGKLLGNGDTVVVRGRVDLISSNRARCNMRLLVDDPDDASGVSVVHVDSCLVELETNGGDVVLLGGDEPELARGAPDAADLATSA